MPPDAAPTENAMLRIPLKFALLAGFGLSLAGALYAPPAAARTQEPPTQTWRWAGAFQRQ